MKCSLPGHCGTATMCAYCDAEDRKRHMEILAERDTLKLQVEKLRADREQDIRTIQSVHEQRDHWQKQAEDALLQLGELKRALYAECRGEACSPDCAGGGYRGCAGCDSRAKMAYGEGWGQTEKREGGTR